MADSRTGTVVELTFELRDRDCAFIAASGELGCTIVGEQSIRRSDGTMLQFFSVNEATDETLEAIESHPSARDARIVHEADGECLIEVLIEGAAVSKTLADEGAVIRSAVAVDGVATVAADVPAGVDPAAAVDRVLTEHPESSLTAKRTLDDRIPGLPDGDRHAILGRLTDKQRRALETALLRGYFAWPRRSSAEECAAALGISQPTFSQHLRHGQEKLVQALFAETTPPSPNDDRHDA